MAPQIAVTQLRLNNIRTCLTETADTLDILANCVRTPFLGAISNTTRSLLKCIVTVKQNKTDCTQLMEQAYELLSVLIIIHIKSDTGGELPPYVLKHIGQLAETLYKIHTFVEAQQNGSKVARFFRQNEMSTLLKDCRVGLQQGLAFFRITTGIIMADTTKMHEEVQRRHHDVLKMIESLSDSTSSDEQSSVRNLLFLAVSQSNSSQIYSGSYTRLESSNSISMLPPEPKIFHGRESELADLLYLFSQGTPRIAILGAGGMGKSSLARAVIHHAEIAATYQQHRIFIACDTVATKVELAALIGAHLGLKPGKDLTQAVCSRFSDDPPTLLILDNLETLWEPPESRNQIEEFLSLLTDVDHLALMKITLRGAERPTRVHWTHPFLKPLRTLNEAAARQTFLDIADGRHEPDEVEKVLALTDNMPLAINLLAHLVDSEGCSSVLSRWDGEKTLLISEGYDKGSNLDLSLSLSLSSPRINSVPQSQELLSLLSMLPDGLSDVDLIQSKLPIHDILSCKTALIRTALAYSDEHTRLKALVPIREYMHRTHPPGDHLMQPLLKHFQEILGFYAEYTGNQTGSAIVGRILSNFANIQNLLLKGLQQEGPDLANGIYCRFYNSQASYLMTHDQDMFAAMEFCQRSLSVSIVTGNTAGQGSALYYLAWCNWNLGDYPTAQLHAYESRRLATVASNFFKEAGSLHIEAMCCAVLGDYKQGIALCDPHIHGFALRKIAEIDVYLGAPMNNVRRNNDIAREIFKTMGRHQYVKMCDIINADLNLRDGNIFAAKTLLEECLKSSCGDPHVTAPCLERLGDISHWGAMHSTLHWTTVFLIHSLRTKEKLRIYKAFQFFGDVFLAQIDEDTAMTLFTLALEGFTQMDIHRNRADCMLRLGDISRQHRNVPKAVELWEAARPLFEQSSQAKQVQEIDERLAFTGKVTGALHTMHMAISENKPLKTAEEEEED
ncbi:hypothetical protein B0H13DRAFT_1910944 [Mycena leptocephala]|nr:hypothetical protein B0H13DRAFT_1910944 [Mycena leptocephala]